MKALSESYPNASALVEIAPRISSGFQAIEQGAATLVWCAIGQQFDSPGGVYCEDCNIGRLMTDEQTHAGVRSSTVDAALAAQRWSLSERLISITFPAGKSR